MSHIWIWIISIATIFCVLARPCKLPEWVFALAGSALLLITGLITPSSALAAVNKGTDVYFFLIGMMLLSEQSRVEGLFDWLAGWTTRHARGSSLRLFLLIYAAGIGVTVFLSNDATAVVLTPAVYAAVKRAGAKPLPYLFACAFIANAASFVLPISNPANLVVYAGRMPAILEWLGMFALPSVASIAVTFAVLWAIFRKPLRVRLPEPEDAPPLSVCGKLTAAGLVAMVAVLMTASAREADLGLPTLVSAAVVLMIVSLKKREWPAKVLRHVAWGVVPLVAGLFVVVEALNGAGALEGSERFLEYASRLATLPGKLLAAFGVGIVSNIVNNLPVGLVSGMAVHHPGVSSAVRNAVLIGVDLGPNLSVTGSLATLLWLMALRRENEPVSGWAFLKAGMIAMPLSLAAAICCS